MMLFSPFAVIVNILFVYQHFIIIFALLYILYIIVHFIYG